MASRKVGMFGVEPNEFIDDRNEDGVAALLRRRREELGRDVPAVARQLRIRAVYITAIEEGRLQDLPGTAYAVGFVRAYADYLGLDGNSIVGDYRDELARRSRQNQLIWPVDQVEHKHFPGGIVLVVSVLVLGALYGGWYFASQPGGTGIDLIDQVPEFMKKQTSEEAPEGTPAPAPETTGPSGAVTQPAGNGTTPSSAQASQAPQAVTPAPVVSVPAAPATAGATTTATVEQPVVTAPLLPEAAANVTATTPAATPTPTPPSTPPVAEDEANVPDATPQPQQLDAAGNEQVAAADSQADEAAEAAAIAADAAPAIAAGKRIVLRATKDSWVEIFDSQEEVVLQRILRAGETFVVPDMAGLTMNTGNAGGVVIELDGKARPSLGSIGVVKRGVKLDPVSLGGQ
jgi:cytoskeleton protein RodZ